MIGRTQMTHFVGGERGAAEHLLEKAEKRMADARLAYDAAYETMLREAREIERLRRILESAAVAGGT